MDRAAIRLDLSADVDFHFLEVSFLILLYYAKGIHPDIRFVGVTRAKERKTLSHVPGNEHQKNLFLDWDLEIKNTIQDVEITPCSGQFPVPSYFGEFLLETPVGLLEFDQPDTLLLLTFLESSTVLTPVATFTTMLSDLVVIFLYTVYSKTENRKGKQQWTRVAGALKTVKNTPRKKALPPPCFPDC